jgi:hypothetical protein
MLDNRHGKTFLRKVAKGLDVKNTEISMLQQQKAALELTIADLRPRKRQKIVPSLGERFVRIAQVQAIQQLAEVTGVYKNPKLGTGSVNLNNNCFGI